MRLIIFLVSAAIRRCRPSPDSGASQPAPVRSFKSFRLLKNKRRLIFHNPELAYPVVLMYHRIAQRIRRHIPPVVRTAVRIVDNARMICLNNAEIFEGTAARHDMRLIALRELHRHSKRNQPEFAALKLRILRRPQINPVGFSVNTAQPFHRIIQILYFYFFHYFSAPLPEM